MGRRFYFTPRGDQTRATLDLLIRAVTLTVLIAAPSLAHAPTGNPYLGASHVPESRSGWERFQTEPDPAAPMDEPMGGKTRRGTLVNKRNIDCFPAEQRNVFSEVDETVSSSDGVLHPFDFTTAGTISDDPKDAMSPRNAIRGQNTWMLWGEGNESFWGWLQEDGYGLIDFLVLLDSRDRDHRFQNGGMINQPGMKAQLDPSKKILGLYLDVADGDAVLLKQPLTDIDSVTHQLEKRVEIPESHKDSKHTQPFEPDPKSGYDKIIAQLPQDGVDPNVYGYPSGVIGLRLMPNPDFFGTTVAAAEARKRWQDKVVSAEKDAYYTDSRVQQDPKLVRPFRVSMSCGFCHAGPHPLNPPADPEAPAWSNVSSTIGDQYWSPPRLFANLVHEDNLLYQFLASQQPGTIDTSLVSTDHINNSNTITAIFDVPARLVRAKNNSPEDQSSANLLSPVIEETNKRMSPRHTPRVLIDGSDSIGVFGALSRVYLNIGTFSEEWAHCHNPLIGFKPQRPFSLATLQAKSLYWQIAEKYRIPYLRAFFTYPSSKTHQSVTAPMKLASLTAGRAIIEKERPLAEQGRAVFLQNCAICHSSKQPEGFELSFSKDWSKANNILTDKMVHITLPASYEDWEMFRSSSGFKKYGAIISDMAKTGDSGEFFTDNYLSTDIRIPITLVGTNSGRAVATNAMRGQVWDNFSSDTYKNLPAVGAVHFYNPFSRAKRDRWNNNDSYYPPAGGPGYYRPASLISVWATAPYLHNNALGEYPQKLNDYPGRKEADSKYIPDPSVEGRLRAFDDGIEKLLYRDKRDQMPDNRPGDLRWSDRGLTGGDPGADGDPGFIYRTTAATWITFPAPFIRPLFVGLLGNSLTNLVTIYVWALVALASGVLAFYAQPRHAGFLFLLMAVGIGVVVSFARLDRVSWLFWLIPAVALVIALLFWLLPQRRIWSQIVFGATAVGAVLIGAVLTTFVGGMLGPMKAGPIPRGTPINLLMNINPEAPTRNLLRAVSGAVRGVLRSRNQKDEVEALQVFQAEAGQPLLEASKCPDFVLDRGHWFGEGLTTEEKTNLKAFLKTL